MANILPSLRGTSKQGLYPYVRRVKFSTTVNTFVNATEQRQPNQPQLYEFDLPMSSLLPADKASWLTFFEGVEGRFEQNLQVTLNGVTYNNLTLLMDDLTVTNNAAQLFEQTIRMRMVSNSPSVVSPVSTFPTFSFGATCQQPFIQSTNYQTGVNDNEYGERFAFAYWDASLSGFPSTFLRRWKINYPLMTDADMALLETFFIGHYGMWISFSFTDPLDQVTYTHVRFGMDTLEVHAITKNQWATSITLVQTNNS